MEGMRATALQGYGETWKPFMAAEYNYFLESSIYNE